MIQKLFRWVFKKELSELAAHLKLIRTKVRSAEYAIIKCEEIELKTKLLLEGVDISADVHEYSKKSWAVISLQGQKFDFIKFIDLKDQDIHEISKFLRNFEKHIKIDATPQASKWLRINNKKYFE